MSKTTISSNKEPSHIVMNLRFLGIHWVISPSWLILLLGFSGVLSQFILPTGFSPSVFDGISLFLIMIVISAASICAHELGHALVSRRIYKQEPTIRLSLTGESTKIETAPNGTSMVLIAAAGPAMNFLVAVALLPLFHMEVAGNLGYIYSFTLLANATLVVINIIPAIPLDGGKIVQGFAYLWTGSMTKSQRVAGFIGCLTAIPILLWILVPAITQSDLTTQLHRVGVPFIVLAGGVIWLFLVNLGAIFDTADSR